MKIAVLIMSSNAEPSLRNVQAMKDTFIKYSNEAELKHEYDFYTYYREESDELGKDEFIVDKDPDYPNYYIIRIGGVESVYRTYEKTYVAYQYLTEFDYDRFIRINTSTYINLKLYDAVVESTDEDAIYTNALNTYIDCNFKHLNGLYPRGDFYMTSKKVIEGILEHGEDLMYCDDLVKNRPDIVHVDDTLFGYAFIKYMGKGYYNHLYTIYYNFAPQQHLSPLLISGDMSELAIATRLKTVPEGQVSGYSWDDNEYRKCEPEKMKMIHNYLITIDYRMINDIKSLIVPDEYERPTLFIRPMNLRPHQIKQILKDNNL